MILQDAKVGQIWQSPGGEYFSVVEVMDFTSTNLIVFEGFAEPEKEALAFSIEHGWKQISNCSQTANGTPELRHH